MDKLFDETFSFEDNVSRNIWYGYIELYRDAEYGKEILLNESLLNDICEIVENNLSEDIKPIPTETNWYLYGKTVTSDAIEDSVRPNIMIREKLGIFLVHCNISDNDFAVNIDKILKFQSDLERNLII